jgi:uncharacterized MnhB-related membrane protein
MIGLTLAVTRPPATAWLAETLQVVLLVLVAAAATLVVLTRVPARQVVLLSFYGLLLSLLFFSFQAPDVTLSEMTVGAAILPLLLLLGLAKMQSHEK